MSRPDPTILVFDTSAAHCAAALLVGGQIVARRFEEMTRGQAERLVPLLEEVLAEADLRWQDLSGIGVGVGPGNFTGIRIAVAAARGLALSLQIRTVGVTTFEIMHATGQQDVVRLSAPRGAAYVQAFDNGTAVGDPYLEPPGDGSPADIPDWAGKGLDSLARIATKRILGGGELPRPAPLYIRPADAAPPREAPPVILP